VWHPTHEGRLLPEESNKKRAFLVSKQIRFCLSALRVFSLAIYQDASVAINTLPPIGGKI
jgi:hypothetical protein